MYFFCCHSKEKDSSRAIAMNEYGDIKHVVRMRKVQIPEVDHNNVLVEIKAVSLSSFDCKLIQGCFNLQLKLVFPYTFGRGFAGIVKKIGDTSSFRSGEYVFGFIPLKYNGALSEYCVIPEDYIAHMPTIPFEKAALYPYGGTVALQILNKIQINKKSVVLISDDSLSIGPFLIQLLKQKGAQIAYMINDFQAKALEKLPIDDLIITNQRNFDTIKYEDRFDVVINYGVFNQMIVKTIKKNGIFVSVDISLPNSAINEPNIKIINLSPAPRPGDLAKIKTMIETSKIYDPEAKIFEFIDIIEALNFLKYEVSHEQVVIKIDSMLLEKSIQEIKDRKTESDSTSSQIMSLSGSKSMPRRSSNLSSRKANNGENERSWKE